MLLNLNKRRHLRYVKHFLGVPWDALEGFAPHRPTISSATGRGKSNPNKRELHGKAANRQRVVVLRECVSAPRHHRQQSTLQHLVRHLSSTASPSKKNLPTWLVSVIMDWRRISFTARWKSLRHEAVKQVGCHREPVLSYQQIVSQRSWRWSKDSFGSDLLELKKDQFKGCSKSTECHTNQQY